MSDINDKLFEDFAPVSTQEWMRKIEADLKGADFERRLVWRTIEGLKVKPFHRSEDLSPIGYLAAAPGEFPFVRGHQPSGNPWKVRQDLEVGTDYAGANAKARHLAELDVTSICFRLEQEPSVQELYQLLDGLALDRVELNFEAGEHGMELLPLLVNWSHYAKLDPKQIRGSLNFDPLGELLTTGHFYWDSQEASMGNARNMIDKASKLMPNLQVLNVNARHFHNAGASASQELGFGIAMGSEYLSLLGQEGVEPAKLAKHLRFTFAVGSNYFLEIAKFRAARLLWAKVLQAYGVPEQDCWAYLHAETSYWNTTLYDPYVNMLRGTTEAMSAAIAGVDSLTVLPFDAAYAKPGEFSERVARNIQHLLRHEAYFDKVADPAGGSYYVESLTHALAEKAWELFQQVEAQGGFSQAFRAGKIQEQVEEMARQRDMSIATRRENLLGTNQFPNFGERMADKIDWQAHRAPRNRDAQNHEGRPLKIYRGGDAFERLRLNTEEAQRTPLVFMATFGNLAMRRARSTFSSNFFGCAGFAIKDNDNFESPELAAQAALEAGADIVVACSSDDEYGTWVPRLKQALGGKAVVVVAGYPAQWLEAFKAEGIENFIHLKSNVLEELQAYQKMLSIA